MEAGVGLGSNQGDRFAHLRAGIAFLRTLARGGRVEVSPFYETAPLDCPPGSGNFVNAVVVFQTDRSPEDLLAQMRSFEMKRGRPTCRARNAPRPLDMDLLYLGDSVRDSADLTLPHPRLASRRFVLQPLCDLRPELVLPGQGSRVKELLAGLPEEGIVRCVESHC